MQNKMHDTETTGSQRVVGGEGISWRRLLPVALFATLLAAVANVLVYFAASSLGLISRSVLLPSPVGESPLTASVVAISSVIGVVGATIVFALVGLFARRPVRLFRIVATAGLVLSFVMPLGTGAPAAMILSLEMMHVVAWAVSVGVLTTLARQAKPASA